MVREKLLNEVRQDSYLAAIRLAKYNWKCKCKPVNASRGSGYDLFCKHKRVEVKGTVKRYPGFRFLTVDEYKQIRRGKSELWVFTNLGSRNIELVKIPRNKVLAWIDKAPRYRINLGKNRLKKLKASRVSRKYLKKVGL